MSTQEKATWATKGEMYTMAAAVLTLVMISQISVVTENKWLQMGALALVMVTQIICGVTGIRAKGIFGAGRD